MTRTYLHGEERYPVYRVAYDDPVAMAESVEALRSEEYPHFVYEVPQGLLERAERAAEEFWTVQRELREYVDPPCPECGHPGSRHQRFSEDRNGYKAGDTACLYRDHEAPEGQQRCRCTTPTPPNPHRVFSNV